MLLIFTLIVLAGWWLGHWIIGLVVALCALLAWTQFTTSSGWSLKKTFALRVWREYDVAYHIQIGWVLYAWRSGQPQRYVPPGTTRR